MITSSPLFVLGIKVVGLTVIAAALFSANVVGLGIMTAAAQQQQQPKMKYMSAPPMLAVAVGLSLITCIRH
jgi:hypothetical protein